eukprot:5238850-Amphidinium_carterae.1
MKLRVWPGTLSAEVVAALSRCKTIDDRKTAKLACGALVNLASCAENREILSTTNVVRVHCSMLLNLANTTPDGPVSMAGIGSQH